MANLYDTSATNALNEDAYINKLYDGTLESQKKALQESYDNSVNQIAAGQENTRQQTSDYLNRADVEAARYGGNRAGQMGNGGANAQARLTMGNQRQVNYSVLRQQQAAADQEFQRLRQLRGEQLAAQIKQAQADNDMARAQALYEAAKAEEEQLRSLRQNAASLMAGKGDNSILDAIANGTDITPYNTDPTWEGVLKHEAGINKIYDAQMESLRQQAQMDYGQKLSELVAKQEQNQRTADSALTAAYVNALKQGQNSREVRNAYGQGSGADVRSDLAREAGILGRLTDIRRQQMGQDAQTEQDRVGLVNTLGQKIANSQADTDRERVQALYDAAKGEEQALVEQQKTIGELLAKQNNYSVLGKLYGLTQDQIDRLQGTGAYAYQEEEPVYRRPNDTVGANQSVIELGRGPISSATLSGLVASGQVKPVSNNGQLGYVNAQNKYGAAGAAMSAAVNKKYGIKK